MSAIKGATPGKWLAHAGTIYALNGDGTNRFSANMQPGNRYQPPHGSSWEEHHAARTSAAELVANAALIVRAVNSHESLVEALAEAIQQIEYLHAKFQRTGSGEAVLSPARAALKLAGDA